MIDSHCHLAGPEFVDDLDAVVTRARDAGVRNAVVILAADDEAELARAAAVHAAWPAVRFAIGVHPHAASAFTGDPEAAARAVESAMRACPGTRAIGEIGLDYHYDHAPRDVQQAVFRAQVRLARRCRLPVVIHTREASDDTFRILDEEEVGTIGGVLHCFAGDWAMAERALAIGFHLSLAGIVTFPRATDLHDVARRVPLDRLLIETDSPFLAPVPLRGRRNEPSFVGLVAARIAALRSESTETIAAATTANAIGLFMPG